MNKNIEEINTLINKHFSRSKHSIVHIGIRKQDETVTYNLSEANDDQLKHFGLGSISKTIISTYLCKLLKEKKINLSDTIDKYLDIRQSIDCPTILQLATHTSGYHAFIPLFPSVFYLLGNGFNKKNFYTNIDHLWFLNDVRKRKPLKRKKYRYSDYNYAVLAYIIESIEKKPYKEVITNFLQQEIGMKDTYYGSLETTKHSKYSWVWKEQNPFLASGGMFSTVDDMLLFLDYQIKHQEYLAPSTRKYVKMNHKNIFSGFSWNAFYKGSFYWHIGGQGRFRSYALFDTKRDISIIILSTVDIDLQHIGRMGSSLYRNIKRNHTLAFDFLDTIGKDENHETKHRLSNEYTNN